MVQSQTLLLLLALIPGSWQRCYDYHCPHHTDLAGCVRGAYTCTADQFCEVTTHLNTGNAPWVNLVCQPLTALPTCWAVSANNDPHCDPNRHDFVCHWCCADDQCMLNLVQGIRPTPDPNFTLPPTNPPQDTATTSGVNVATSTNAPTGVCEDVYLGDCLLDYGGRCNEALIQQLCMKSCRLCS